jgi:hypothetical protein
MFYEPLAPIEPAGWYFWDGKDWEEYYGPYETKEQAESDCAKYNT